MQSKVWRDFYIEGKITHLRDSLKPLQSSINFPSELDFIHGTKKMILQRKVD